MCINAGFECEEANHGYGRTGGVNMPIFLQKMQSVIRKLKHTWFDTSQNSNDLLRHVSFLNHLGCIQ